MTDYKSMSGPELLTACGMDAAKWADAFQRIVVEPGIEIDEGLMTGWFASAIMNTLDLERGNRPHVLPDGSAFFIGEV